MKNIKKQPNKWIEYERIKRLLEEMNLPSDKYQRLIKELCKQLNI